MNELIDRLVRPAPPSATETAERLAGVRDWEAFRRLVARTGCAPLIHERLRNHMEHIPRDVAEWLRACHNRTIESNRRLLDELEGINALMTEREIPALVLKGPALAVLGTGLRMRSFHDLDLLVRPDDLADASAALSAGRFIELPSEHPCHRIFVKMAPAPPTIIEVHFDLVDPERGYIPNLSGVWNRAVSLDLGGCSVMTPSITDHLLLAIMQLPHHVWAPHLLVDIAHVATRWTNAIDWDVLIERSQAWKTHVLTGSSLYAAASLLRLSLPPAAVRMIEPKTYVQHVQWRLVFEALSEQMRCDPPRLGRAVSFLVVDRPGTALALAPRMLFGPGDRRGWENLSGIGRRLRKAAASVPALFAIVCGNAVTRRERVH